MHKLIALTNGEEGHKLKEWFFDPQIEKMITKTLCNLGKTNLLGQTISDAVGSVTVSSTVAYGLWESGEKTVAKQIVNKFLQHQITSGEDEGAFPGFGSKSHASTWATINALRVSLLTDPSLILDNRIELCISWLTKVQKKKGGWGVVRETPTRPFYTAHGLLAMLQAYESVREAKKLDLNNLQVATLKTLERMIKKSIKKAKKYLLSQRLGSLPIWSQNLKMSDACIASTLMSLLALAKYGNLFKPVLRKEDVEKVYFDQLKPIISTFKEYKAGSAWPEIRETVPAFVVYFHPPASLYVILELGIDPWDDLCFEMLLWLKNNYIKEGPFCGWKGTPTNSPNKILLWATGYGLISLARLREVLRDIDRDKMLDQIFRPSSIEEINSERYKKRIEKCEERVDKIKRTRNILLIALVVLAAILTVTNLDFLLTGWSWIASKWSYATPLFAILSAVAAVLAILRYLRTRKR